MLNSKSGIYRPAVLTTLALALIMVGCESDAVGPPPFQPESISRLSIPGIAYVQVSAGTDHTCALREDGVVECWGDNAFGKAPSTREASAGSFSWVSAGALHTCALRDDDVVECWGNNGSGQAPASRIAMVGGFIRVDAGTDHTCGLREDDVVECWGNNNLGKAPTSRVAASSSFFGVDAAATHSCAPRLDGVVECWGNNSSGQAPATRSPVSSTFVEVSGGSLHTCGRRADGAVECWGSNSAGRAPTLRVAASGAYSGVSSGGSHTCGLRTDGVVECWGNNLSGQAPGIRTPVFGTFAQVSSGGNHTCAVRTDGIVECWGANYDGQAPATRTTETGPVIVLPTAVFIAPEHLDEGSTAVLSLADPDVSGHDGAPFQFAFDCGSGYGSFSSEDTFPCPVVDGLALLEMGGIVRDRDRHTREYRQTVTVHNVAPIVGPLASMELLLGETYSEQGDFEDPGTDEHVATADYGDGAGPEPLTLDNLHFSLEHTYRSTGTFTVSVEVTDDDGAMGSGEATVNVLSLAEFVDRMTVFVDGLKRERVLVRGQGPKLVNELRRVARYLSRGSIDAALSSLDEFVALVEGLEADGAISDELAGRLVGDADRLRSASIALF